MTNQAFYDFFTNPALLWLIIVIEGLVIVCIEMARLNAVDVIAHQDAEMAKGNAFIQEQGTEIVKQDELILGLYSGMDKAQVDYTEAIAVHDQVLADVKRDLNRAENAHASVSERLRVFTNASHEQEQQSLTNYARLYEENKELLLDIEKRDLDIVDLNEELVKAKQRNQDEIRKHDEAISDLQHQLKKASKSKSGSKSKSKGSRSRDYQAEVTQYRLGNPGATKAQAMRDLSIGSPNTLNKYWVDLPLGDDAQVDPVATEVQ